MGNGLVGKEKEKFERARERAIELNIYAYVPPLEAIISELKKIEKLDQDYAENKGTTMFF